MTLSDTQTGLRAIPRTDLELLSNVSGDRFEYETNMLLSLGDYGIKLAEQTIETVYIEENQTSHFRPVRDSIRIYSLILKFLASSVIAAVVDVSLYYLGLVLLSGLLGTLARLIAFFIARAISSCTNFTINKHKVFENSDSVGRTLLRYYALAIPIMVISIGGVELFEYFIGNGIPIITTLVKIAVDVIMFICSFRIQRAWVFAKRKNKD